MLVNCQTKMYQLQKFPKRLKISTERLENDICISYFLFFRSHYQMLHILHSFSSYFRSSIIAHIVKTATYIIFLYCNIKKNIGKHHWTRFMDMQHALPGCSWMLCPTTLQLQEKLFLHGCTDANN